MASSMWDLAVAELHLSPAEKQMFQAGTATPVEILDEILATVEKLRGRCRREQWKVRSIFPGSGRDIVIRDVCAKVAACVKKFIPVVDVAVSFDPVHAALPWAGLRAILQLCLDAFEGFASVVEGLEMATALMARCGIVEALYLSHDRAGPAALEAQNALGTAVGRLHVAILRFLCRVRDHLTAGVLARLRDKEALETAVADMARAEQVFQAQRELVHGGWLRGLGNDVSTVTAMLAAVDSKLDGVESMRADLDTMAVTLRRLDQRSSRNLYGLSDLFTALEDGKREAILGFLSSIPVQQHYHMAHRAMLPGTGRWLLTSSSFVGWETTSAPEVFWLHGAPGCGKTNLTTAVIEHLRTRDDLDPGPVAHFYCSREPAEPERSSATEILRSIVKQLALARDSTHISRAVVDEYEKRVERARRHGEAPERLRLQECVRLACEICEQSPATLVIDALDECPSSQRTVLLTALEEISSCSRDLVKVFVSSRDNGGIMAQLRGARSVRVTPEKNKDDLVRFVHSRVDGFMAIWLSYNANSNNAEECSKLREEITEMLIAGSQGMFLWVALQLQTLSDGDRIKNEEDIRLALKVMPASLRESYDAIHQRIGRMGQASQGIAHRAFGWLLYAGRRLSVRELLAAVGRTSTGLTRLVPEQIVDCCCNLVILDGETNTFRLAHPTVREHLETMDSYAAGEADLAISLRCLGAYLWDGKSGDELEAYAACYWPVHVARLGDSLNRSLVIPTVVDLLLREDDFDAWVRTLEGRSPEVGGPCWNAVLETKLRASTSTPPSPLFVVCSFGLVEVLDDEELLEELDLRQKNGDGSTALYLASRFGHLQVVQKLLDLGQDPDAEGYRYGTALTAACFNGFEDIVELLLKRGASCGGAGGELPNPMLAAVKSGHDSIAALLIQKGFRFADQQQFEDAMRCASSRGDVDTIQLLLKGGAGTFTLEEPPDPLQVALYGGRTRRARAMLQSCVDINEQKGYFGNALQAAIAGGKPALVRAVVEAGARLDVRGVLGYPIRAAAVTGNAEIIKYLLEKGADPNAEDRKLGDALQAAASMGHMNAMLILLDNEANIHGYGGEFGDTLQAAAVGGHEQAVRLLLERGAIGLHPSHDPDTCPRRGVDPLPRFIFPGAGRSCRCPEGRYVNALYAAVFAGQEHIVRILLESRAAIVETEKSLHQVKLRMRDLFRISGCAFKIGEGCRYPGRENRAVFPRTYKDKKSQVPTTAGLVELAAWGGNLDIATLLLDAGANVDGDHDDWTGLQLAAFLGQVSMLELLLDYGANVDKHRPILGTALAAALEQGHFDAAEVLLSRGADINAKLEIGSYLHRFCEEGNINVVGFLIDHNADIHDAGGWDGNALQVACTAGHIDIVRLLLDRGADLDAPGKENGTALQCAAAADHYQIVCMLLDRGADSTGALVTAAEMSDIKIVLPIIGRARECEKSTALRVAAAAGRGDVVTALVEGGADVHWRETSRVTLRRSERLLRPLAFYYGSPPRPYERPGDSDALLEACSRGHTTVAQRLFLHDPQGYVQRETLIPALRANLEIDWERRGMKERLYYDAAAGPSLVPMLVKEGFNFGLNIRDFLGLIEIGREHLLGTTIELLLPEEMQPALLRAAAEGHGRAVAMFLARGADVNRPDEEGQSALFLAVRRVGELGDDRGPWCQRADILLRTEAAVEAVQVLLRAGATAKDLSARFDCILCTLASCATDEIVSLLRHGGCCMSPENAAHNCEALEKASRAGNLDVVRHICKLRRTQSKELLSALMASLACDDDQNSTSFMSRERQREDHDWAMSHGMRLPISTSSPKPQHEDVFRTLLKMETVPDSFADMLLMQACRRNIYTQGLVVALLKRFQYTAPVLEDALRVAAYESNKSGAEAILGRHNSNAEFNKIQACENVLESWEKEKEKTLDPSSVSPQTAFYYVFTFYKSGLILY